MNKELEKIWKSYNAQEKIINIKSSHKKLNSLYEEAIKEISTIYGKEKAISFISWLYEYIGIIEKIAFEVGYNYNKK